MKAQTAQPEVVLVSTFEEPCGIAEHSAYWKAAVEAQGLRVEVETNLHPNAMLGRTDLPPVVVLNYQAALLSQWHPEHLRELHARGSKSLVIYHDSGVPNSDQCKAICAAADHFVLHEPYDDLSPNGTYLRQGIPDWEDPSWRFDPIFNAQVRDGIWWGKQPIVGTVGLSLGYRNIDLLCEAAELAGWGVLALASRATDEEVARWKELCPACVVVREFVLRESVVSYLAGCTATAQLTVTNNTGTSGGIRQCIAARKPVLAFPSRQFADLLDISSTLPEGCAVRWLQNGTPAGVALALMTLTLESIDPFVVALAHRDSWRNAGKVYARIIRELLV